MLKVEKIAKYARMVGLGQKTGIELFGETEGLVPDKKWKRKVHGETWYKGDTTNFSIGQGYLLTTPIQLLVSMNTMINGGHWIQPSMVKQIISHDDQKYDPPAPKRRALNFKKNLEVLKEGMRLSVNNPYGTGRQAQN